MKEILMYPPGTDVHTLQSNLPEQSHPVEQDPLGQTLHDASPEACQSQEGACSCGCCSPGVQVDAASIIPVGAIGIGQGLAYHDTELPAGKPELSSDRAAETDQPRETCNHHEPHEEAMCSCCSGHEHVTEEANSSDKQCSCCHDSEPAVAETHQHAEARVGQPDFSFVQNAEARDLLEKRFDPHCIDEGDNPGDPYFRLYLLTKGGHGQPRRVVMPELRHGRFELDTTSEKYTQLVRHWEALGMDMALLPTKEEELAPFVYACLIRRSPDNGETTLHIEDPAYALLFDDFEVYHSPELLQNFEYVDDFYAQALAEAQHINKDGSPEEKAQLMESADGCCDIYSSMVKDLHFHGAWEGENKARMLIPLALLGFEQAEMMLHLLAQERDNPVYSELGKALADIPQNQLAMELSKMVVQRIEQKQAEQQAKEASRAGGETVVELERTWKGRYRVIAKNILLLANHEVKLDDQTRETVQRVASPKYIGWQMRNSGQNPFEQHNSKMTDLFLQELRQQRLEQHAADNPEGIVHALARLSPELQDKEVVAQLEETRSNILQAGIPDDVRHISYILTLATEIQTRPVPDGEQIQPSEEESHILDLAEQLNQRGHYLAHYLPEEGHPEGYHFAVDANGHPEACGDCTHATDQQLEQIHQEVQQATEHIDLNEPRQQAETAQEQQDPPTSDAADLRAGAEPVILPKIQPVIPTALPADVPDGLPYISPSDDLLRRRTGGGQRSEQIPDRVESGVVIINNEPRASDGRSSRSSGSDGGGIGREENGSGVEPVVNSRLGGGRKGGREDGREDVHGTLFVSAATVLTGGEREEKNGDGLSQRQDGSSAGEEKNNKHIKGRAIVAMNIEASTESEGIPESRFDPEIQVDSFLGWALVTACPNATGKPTKSYSLRVYRDGSYFFSTNGTSRAMTVTTSFSHSSGETYTINLYHGSELLKSSDWTPEANSLIAPNQSKQSPSAYQPSRKTRSPVLPIQVINREGDITTITPSQTVPEETSSKQAQKEPDIGAMIVEAMRATESEASPATPAVAEGPAGRGEMRETVDDINSSPIVAADSETDASSAASADQGSKPVHGELRAEDKPGDSYALSPLPESDDPAGGSMAMGSQAAKTVGSLRIGDHDNDGNGSLALKAPATAEKQELTINTIGNGGDGMARTAPAEDATKTMRVGERGSGGGAGMEQQLPAQKQRMKLDGSDPDSTGSIAMHSQTQEIKMRIGGSPEGGSGTGMARPVSENKRITVGAEGGTGNGNGGMAARTEQRTRMTAGSEYGSGGGSGARTQQREESQAATMSTTGDGLTVSTPEAQVGRREGVEESKVNSQTEEVKESKVEGRRPALSSAGGSKVKRSQAAAEQQAKTRPASANTVGETIEQLQAQDKSGEPQRVTAQRFRSTPTARQVQRMTEQGESAADQIVSAVQQSAEGATSSQGLSIAQEAGTYERAAETGTTPAHSLRRGRAAQKAAGQAQQVGSSAQPAGQDDPAAQAQSLSDLDSGLQKSEPEPEQMDALTQREVQQEIQIIQEEKLVERTRTGKAVKAKQLEVSSTPHPLDISLQLRQIASQLGYKGKIRVLQPPLNKKILTIDMNTFREVLYDIMQSGEGNVLVVGWKTVGKYVMPIVSGAQDARTARKRSRSDKKKAVALTGMRNSRQIAQAA